MMTHCLFLDPNCHLVILVHRILLACFLLVILILILIIQYRLVSIVILQHVHTFNTSYQQHPTQVLVCDIPIYLYLSIYYITGQREMERFCKGPMCHEALGGQVTGNIYYMRNKITFEHCCTFLFIFVRLQAKTGVG